MAKAACESRGDVMESCSDGNKLEKNKGSYKTTATNSDSDSGTTDSELRGAAGSIYSKSVRNGGGSGEGQKAIQKR